jgi:hypothetical protein
MAYFAPSSGQQQNSPVDFVRTLRAQGMDNNQIIQALQRQGLSSNVIFDAMNQTELNPQTEQTQNQDNFQNYPVFSQPEEPMSPRPKMGGMQDSTSNEELVEAIVEEKWNELLKDFNKIIEWKNSTTVKIAAMEQKIEDMRHEFDKLHSGVIAKVDDYDKNISNVGAEVKAMEKVFSKVLPVFAENVSELSRIARDLKQKPIVKTKLQ